MSMILYELVGADESRPFSPHCWKARMALRHKGLDYEMRPVPFTEVPTVENSFWKTIPVLRDGERLVGDSFSIAEHLDEAYPDRPTLFGGEGGRRLSRFVESWSQSTVHPALASMILVDIWQGLAEPDRAYFRRSREASFGKPLEAVVEDRDARREQFFANGLKPLAALLGRQPFLGGDAPLFADFIVFGAFQWARICSAYRTLPTEGPVAEWFEHCLALAGAEGRKVPAAASLAA